MKITLICLRIDSNELKTADKKRMAQIYEETSWESKKHRAI